MINYHIIKIVTCNKSFSFAEITNTGCININYYCLNVERDIENVYPKMTHI